MSIAIITVSIGNTLHFANLREAGISLPSGLYLQLDNTAWANKNHVLSFLSLLVQLKVYDEVRADLLRPGGYTTRSLNTAP